MKKGIALIAVVVLVGSLGAVIGMPMSSCTPEQIAAILLQPTKDEIAGYRADLVAGDLTESEYIFCLKCVETRLNIQLLQINLLRGGTVAEIREGLTNIFGWNVRAGSFAPFEGGYANGSPKSQLVDSIAK